MQGVLSELCMHQLHPVFENALNILGVECIILSVKNVISLFYFSKYQSWFILRKLFMFLTLWWTFWFAYFANGRNVSVGYSIKCFNLTICFSSRLWLSGLWQALLCFSYKMHVYKRTLRFKWCVNASIIGLLDFLLPSLFWRGMSCVYLCKDYFFLLHFIPGSCRSHVSTIIWVDR